MLVGDLTDLENVRETVPAIETIPSEYLPESFDWTKSDKADCIHPIRSQGSCGSCWTFSVAGTVSDLCCIAGKDHGWLAPQELVSCDTNCKGCHGGDRNVAMKYVVANGLVPESCYPYLAKDAPCPKKCVNGGDWKAAHVCKCKAIHNCQGVEKLKTCLNKGPVAVGMIIYEDFLHYKSGVYHWDKKSKEHGPHAMRAVGYGNKPENYWNVANTFGTSWGEKGYVRMGFGEVGIDTREPVICDPTP